MEAAVCRGPQKQCVRKPDGNMSLEESKEGRDKSETDGRTETSFTAETDFLLFEDYRFKERKKSPDLISNIC